MSSSQEQASSRWKLTCGLGAFPQCAGLVGNRYKQSASADVAGLHCSNDGNIERDHPQGTSLTRDAAARESHQRQYGRWYEDEDAKGQPEPDPEKRADDCERSHARPPLS